MIRPEDFVHALCAQLDADGVELRDVAPRATVFLAEAQVYLASKATDPGRALDIVIGLLVEASKRTKG